MTVAAVRSLSRSVERRHAHSFLNAGPMIRSNPMLWLAGGSIVALAVLISLLYWESRPATVANRALVRVYCAAALRPIMEAIGAVYTRETGERVELEYGDSGRLLGQVTIREDGDLFLPADDSYIQRAREKGLIAWTIPLCRMQAVVLSRPGIGIASMADLLKPELRLGLANPDRAAIGKVARDHLMSQGKWEALAARIDVQHFNVADAANAVQLGSRDATIVWDVVALNYPDLVTVRLPELEGAIGRVELAVLNRSPNREAADRFARFVGASDAGLTFLRKAGFKNVADGIPWRGGQP
jgi:molybdate transport system substrate-binding protein